MKRFSKIGNDFLHQLFSQKNFILDVWLDFKYAPGYLQSTLVLTQQWEIYFDFSSHYLLVQS